MYPLILEALENFLSSYKDLWILIADFSILQLHVLRHMTVVNKSDSPNPFQTIFNIVLLCCNLLSLSRETEELLRNKTGSIKSQKIIAYGSCETDC